MQSPCPLCRSGFPILSRLFSEVKWSAIYRTGAVEAIQSRCMSASVTYINWKPRLPFEASEQGCDPNGDQKDEIRVKGSATEKLIGKPGFQKLAKLALCSVLPYHTYW